MNLDGRFDISPSMRRSTYVLVESDDWEVAIPCTRLAAREWGQGTDWCTGYDEAAFAQYMRDGALMIFRQVRTGRLWQLHPASGEFRDARNRRASWRGFVQREPKLLAMLMAALAALDPTRGVTRVEPTGPHFSAGYM